MHFLLSAHVAFEKRKMFTMRFEKRNAFMLRFLKPKVFEKYNAFVLHVFKNAMHLNCVLKNTIGSCRTF